jgi:hypothetical protein
MRRKTWLGGLIFLLLAFGGSPASAGTVYSAAGDLRHRIESERSLELRHDWDDAQWVPESVYSHQ